VVVPTKEGARGWVDGVAGAARSVLASWRTYGGTKKKEQNKNFDCLCSNFFCTYEIIYLLVSSSRIVRIC